MKKHKALKITGIVVAVLLVIGIVFAVIFIKIIDSSNGPVEDYDKRVEIWNTVAGNCSRSKLDDRKHPVPVPGKKV